MWTVTVFSALTKLFCALVCVFSAKFFGKTGSLRFLKLISIVWQAEYIIISPANCQGEVVQRWSNN